MVSDSPGGLGGQDIYVSHRATINDAWGPPQNLGPKINTDANDYCPFVLPDGHTLLFLSNRAGGLGMGDFYMATRQNTADDLAWDHVQAVTELNSASDEFGPSGFENPATGVLTLFFNSNRPGGPGGYDIYTSQLGPDGKFTPPQLVPELNTSSNDQWPVVRQDGLEFTLISNRSGTLGGNDIWISERGSIQDPWSTPVNLGPIVNTASGEGRAWLFAGGTRIIFFSNRAGGQGGNDLYETTRTQSNMIPVVGSVVGYGGTAFKTFAQITNPYSTAISGSLVFHPAGQSSAASDPRISYTLAAFETRTFADLMASIGTTGVGSLEIAPAMGPAPASVVRIDDGGSVIVPQIRTEDVLYSGSRAVLTTPSDLTRFRFNIGVRTLSAGASMTISLYDASGTFVRTTSRSFPANYFTQMSASDFIGGSIAANQSIVISIDAGSVVVYGSTASSTGVGSTLQIAARVVQ